MNYKKIYDSIIEKAKSENRKKGYDVYYELHHIIPKCIGGGEEKENKVLLTAREHYVCHKILHYLHPNNTKLSKSYFAMSHIMKCKRKLKLTSREYEEARIANHFATKGEKHPMYGKKHSLEAVKKISESRKGKKLNEETKDKIRKHQLGKSKSKESILKQLETKYNKTQEEKDTVRLNRSKSLIGKNKGKKKSIETILKREETKRNRPKYKKDITFSKLSESHKRENLSDETLIKMSKSNGGENNGFYGKKHSPETLSKMRDAKIGKPSKIKGVPKSEEHKQKLSKPKSEEIKNKISQTKKTYWDNIRQERAVMIF